MTSVEEFAVKTIEDILRLVGTQHDSIELAGQIYANVLANIWLSYKKERGSKASNFESVLESELSRLEEVCLKIKDGILEIHSNLKQTAEIPTLRPVPTI